MKKRPETPPDVLAFYNKSLREAVFESPLKPKPEKKDTPVMKARIAFEKELETQPATIEELWIALQCLADDYVPCKNLMDPCLDYLISARKLVRAINNPGKLIPWEEVKRRINMGEIE
jgi:hypothetical protein